MRYTQHPNRLIGLLLSLALILQGCAGAVVVGVAGGTATAANDKRTMGQIVEDQVIEVKALQRIAEDMMLSKDSNISAISFNGTLLLVGQVRSEKLKKRATKVVRGIKKVRSIHNHIAVTRVTTIKEKGRDAWLSARVKGVILGEEGLNGLNIKVVVKNKVLYLMGIVTREEAARIVQAVQDIKGLDRIVQVFEYSKLKPNTT